MPNSLSATKRMRANERKRERNQAALAELKTISKKLGTMTSDPAKAKEFAQHVISRYDRAVTRGIIPRGRADRKKSRIALFLAKLNKTSK